MKLLNVKGAADSYTRKEIDGLAEFAAIYGAKGLAWLKVDEEGLKGPIAKFFEGEEGEALKAAADAETGDLLLFVADKKEYRSRCIRRTSFETWKRSQSD